MKYGELPMWAQKRVKEWVKEQYLQMDEEARRCGENVPHYTDEELEEVSMQYLNDKDDFEIEYDEDGENPIVIY